MTCAEHAAKAGAKCRIFADSGQSLRSQCGIVIGMDKVVCDTQMDWLLSKYFSKIADDLALVSQRLVGQVR